MPSSSVHSCLISVPLANLTLSPERERSLSVPRAVGGAKAAVRTRTAPRWGRGRGAKVSNRWCLNQPRLAGDHVGSRPRVPPRCAAAFAVAAYSACAAEIFRASPPVDPCHCTVLFLLRLFRAYSQGKVSVGGYREYSECSMLGDSFCSLF